MSWQDDPIVTPASPWMSDPIVTLGDNGQSLASSALSSAGRGAASIVPGVIGGVGVLVGSESMQQTADEIEAGINEALPVNPAHADTWTVKGAGAIGNAVGFLGTSGVGGLVGKGFGAIRAGAEVASLGSAFLSGTREGAQEAERYGIEGDAAYGRALLGGLTEVASEKLLFGLGTETAAARRLLGDATVEGKWFRPMSAIYSEAGEEAAAQIGGNLATRALAPPNVEAPGVFDRVGEAAALGAIGGGFFGGVNLALSPSGAPAAPMTFTKLVQSMQPAPVPEEPFETTFGGVPYRFDGTAWNGPYLPTSLDEFDSSPNPPPTMAPLNANDPIEGALIAHLEGMRQTQRRAKQGPGIDKATSDTQIPFDEPPDSPFQTFDFRPVEDEALSDADRELLTEVRRADGSAAVGAVVPVAKGGVEAASAAKLGEALKQVFGKTIFFVAPKAGKAKPISFNGISIDGHRNSIVIDATAKDPLIHLTGHELVHALKAQRPELWNELRDGLSSLASDWTDYQDRLRAMKYDDHQMVDEFLGDFVGNQFREPAFWQRMEARNPSLFGRMARAALDFLDRILNAVGGLSRDVRGYFKDIEAARDVVASALEKYATDRIFPEKGGLKESSDVDLQKSVSEEAKPLRSVRSPNVQRMGSRLAELQKGWNWTKSNQEERTIEGEAVEPVAYLIRSNAEMLGQADAWLDEFASEMDGLDVPVKEQGQALVKALQTGQDPITGEAFSADVGSAISVALLPRIKEFGLTRGAWDAARQQVASEAGRGLNLQKVYDPLAKAIEEGEAQTNKAFTKVTGTDINKAYTDLENEVQKAQAEASADVAKELRDKIAELKAQLKEEKARADQQREVGIAIGREEGLAEGLAQQPEAPEAQLETLELWLMGEKVEGLPSFETTVLRFFDISRFDQERFTNALKNLFPALDPNILDDAMERAAERIHNSLAAARRRAIEEFLDRLDGKLKSTQDSERLGRFFSALNRAEKFGVLDQDVFVQAFAHSFELHGMTLANAQQLRDLWQEIQRVDENGRRVHYGKPRETLETRFAQAVNAIAPAARWDNFIFDSYLAGILASLGSMMNQFSPVFRVFAGVDALGRGFANKDMRAVLPEWWAGVRNTFENLPMFLTGVRGEALGHLPASVRGGFTPSEQTLQNTGPGQQMRIKLPTGRTITLSDGTRKVFRAKELWTWRAIRGIEAISGITDAQARYRDVLADFYRRQGMSAAEARDQALTDIAGSPADQTAAEKQAREEQEQGLIGRGAADVKDRIREIIQHRIDERLGEDLTARVEMLTAAVQFKSEPLGPVGFVIYRMFKAGTNSKTTFGRVTRFFALFGRFLGHTVDTMLAYAPGVHLLTLASTNPKSDRLKLIRQVFGSAEAYNAQQHGKAVAGGAFFVLNGLLMMLAHALAGDDEEPFFSITGTAPMASRQAKDALAAASGWQEGTVSLFGQRFNYMQIPELAGLMAVLGNLSDYMRHGDTLYGRAGSLEGEDPDGRYVASIEDLLMSVGKDWATSPIKRSTWRQYFEAMDAAMSNQKTDSFSIIFTAPVDGALRLPLLVDADKLYNEAQGSKNPEGFKENLIRRLPFVHVGETMYNGFGEKLPALGTISMFPPEAEVPEDVRRAAKINVDTGTFRSVPHDPELKNADGTIKLVSPEDRDKYVELAGAYYTESLLRNEEAIRRAYAQGGTGAAKKIVSNISLKANERAKKQMFGK